MTLVLASCFNPTKKDMKSNFVEYGTFKVDQTQAITVPDMMTDFRENGNKRTTYTISAPIEEVCAKAGCWINIKGDGAKNIMVRFKDHFTIPTDTKLGTVAFLHGDLYVDTVSVDMLRHYAEDAGKPKEDIEKITQPRITMGFEADGIKFTPMK